MSIYSSACNSLWEILDTHKIAVQVLINGYTYQLDAVLYQWICTPIYWTSSLMDMHTNFLQFLQQWVCKGLVSSSITQQWVIRNFISVLINVIHDVYNKEAFFFLREIPQGGKYIKSKYFILFEDNLEWSSCSSVIKQQVHIDCMKWWHLSIHPFIKGR